MFLRTMLQISIASLISSVYEAGKKITNGRKLTNLDLALLMAILIIFQFYLYDCDFQEYRS